MSRYKLVKTNDLYRLIDTSDNSDSIRYSEAQSLLCSFYRNGLHANLLEPILERLKDDLYFYLIEEIYKNNTVLEWLAESNGTDVSTIKRNKKRLTFIIYNLWEEAVQNE